MTISQTQQPGFNRVLNMGLPQRPAHLAALAAFGFSLGVASPAHSQRYTQVSAGLSHTCAVLASGGGVQCWGAGSNGRLGNGSTSDSNTPVAVTGITHATSVSAGGGYTCAVLASGGARCWGEGGNGSTASSSTSVSVNGITSAIAVSAGDAHRCALLTTGAIRCRGFGGNGALGNGTAGDQLTSVPVYGITTATQIDTGGSLACARLSDTTLRCWGSDFLTSSERASP